MNNEILEAINEEINKLFNKDNLKDVIYKSCGSDIKDFTYSYIEKIIEPSKFLIQNGGKRWRPTFMVLISKMLGIETNVLQLAPVVELIHNGTLIVDDIEDKAEKRRGNPCVHVTYGVDYAINSGNFLYFLPTFLIDQTDFAMDIKLKLHQTCDKYLRRVHLGQGIDIIWHRDFKYIPTEEEYFEMCKLKTGSLTSMATEFSGICSYCSNDELIIIREISESIGLAFQIYDDIINITHGNIGKDCGDDIVEGKKSLPVILFAKNNDPTELLQLMEEAQKLGIINGQKVIEKAINILKSSDAIDIAKVKAEELVEIGKNNIKKFANNIYQDALLALIDKMFAKMKL